ncbi:MAG: RNase P subunit p30 family protein [Candidatus Bathyarchaeota archaeon]|jgi:RNase P/RNase MRP subunit p30
MRHFIDLHLRDPGEEQLLREMLETTVKLGFNSVAVSSEVTTIEDLRGYASDIGLDLVSRLDLRPRNSNELIIDLRRKRKSFEIVAVECNTKSVARQAAKDHRVDILTFPFNRGKRKTWFDKQEATLAAGTNCAYEFNLSELLVGDDDRWDVMMGRIRQDIENAMRVGVPVVTSSGAQHPLGLRDPRTLASVMSLFDLDEEEGLDTVSLNPKRILKRNRDKLAPGFVVPGVREVSGCP